MTSKKTLAGSLVSLSTGLLVAVSAIGGATASSATSQDTTQLQVTSTPASSPQGYWTPERMRAAVPGEVLAAKAVARQERTDPSASVAVETGTATRIAGTAAQSPVTAALHAAEVPVKHIGKVFFTLGGVNFVCSGNSVAATNRSLVATAGHCVNEGPGAFATNWIFVPGYVDGRAPYGQWPARSLHAARNWTSNGDIRYDTGFAVVSRVRGRALADVVGASGVEFGQPRGLTYKSYGYPAAPPFTGQKLVSCTGTAHDDTINPQFKSQGIACDMTGGSSGGPWFAQGGGTDASGAGGFQNSVNSYGYGTRSTTMFGPFWGSTIMKVYNSAQKK
ncbi:trypsin-like serine peptidase [Arthrobacter sp. NPDC057388]|jgi:V8-like Glu-specific endopeptidase|uniref:trypsin-like serine peptidase n=1 Tax=Arthrobacter sp. NPDC057388 TaxID=3346116 RepID=UPI003630DACB